MRRSKRLVRVRSCSFLFLDSIFAVAAVAAVQVSLVARLNLEGFIARSEGVGKIMEEELLCGPNFCPHSPPLVGRAGLIHVRFSIAPGLPPVPELPVF